MSKKLFKTLLLLSVILMFVFVEQSHSQDEGKVIIISPKVGEVIDLEERNRYKFFQAFSEFKSAVFLQLPDSTFAVKIVYLENGVQKSQLWKLSVQELQRNYKQPIDMSEPQRLSFRAKENPLIVINWQNQQIEGRLLGLEADSVLLGNVQSLLESKPTYISINEIKSIRIKKKSGFLKGFGYGLLIGGGTGAIIGFASGDDPPGLFSMSAEDKAGIGAISLGLLGGIIGSVAGLLEGKDQRFDLSQKSYYEKINIVKRLLEGN